MKPTDRITQINARLLAAGLAPLDSEQCAVLSVTPLTQSDREQIEGLFETLCGRCGVDCADLNPLDPIPAGWENSSTGGGCTALTRKCGRLTWLIVDSLEAPTSADEPCTLALYIGAEGEQVAWWECSCLAEAVTIAEGAKDI